MKILLIGGTGTISTDITLLLCSQGHSVYLLNRGTKNASLPKGIHILQSDIHEETAVQKVLAGQNFDVVANFIAYTPEDVQRDVRLFAGLTSQYIFISSASAYQKPLSHPIITESTPLANPFWQYSRDKISCELFLQQQYRETGFPITIVRPSTPIAATMYPLRCTATRAVGLF